MKELIGKKCAIIFNLPIHECPIPGHPAVATIEAVDMPMVKLNHYGSMIWVNCSIFKAICEA